MYAWFAVQVLRTEEENMDINEDGREGGRERVTGNNVTGAISF